MSSRPTTRPRRGGRYCSAFDCKNNSESQMIDPRNGKVLKFHRFPFSINANCESSAWEESLPSAAPCPNVSANNCSPNEENCPPHSFELENEDNEVIATVPLNKMENETVVYIAGAACRKIFKNCSCFECRNLMVSPREQIMIFSSYKNYTDNALLNTSLQLRELVKKMEEHFKAIYPAASLQQNPRNFIVDHLKKSTSLLETFICSKHGNKIITQFLIYYYNTRLFNEVKLFNLNLKLKKKGNELNKDKKLNM